MTVRRYRMVVMGASAGGLQAMKAVLSALPASFPVPVVMVQHQSPGNDSHYLACFLDNHSPLQIREARHGESPEPGAAYISPAGYHLQVEESGQLSLSVDLPVNFSIPAIDVLFETVADACGDRVIGVILTGASSDGSGGLRSIKQQGGIGIVQSPDSAESQEMPLAAIREANPDYIVPLDAIGPLLNKLLNADPKAEI